MKYERQSPTAAQRERLLHLITRRRIEARSDELHIAFWRLELALTKRVNVTPDLAILDWLEAELEMLRRTRPYVGETATVLLEQAREFCGALRT